MSGHRHAAVALQALALDDRHAILAELPAADRELLSNYLTELDSLGFDCAAVNDSLIAPPSPSAPTSADRVRQANAPDMLALLAGEPVQCVAALLAIEPWAWTEEFKAGWGPSTPHALDTVNGQRSAPALHAALLAETARRLGPARSMPTAPSGSRLSVFGRKVMQWIR